MKVHDPLAQKSADSLLHVYLFCSKEGLTLAMDEDKITVTMKSGKVFEQMIKPAGNRFAAESAIYRLLIEVKAALRAQKEVLFDEKILHDKFLAESL